MALGAVTADATVTSSVIAGAIALVVAGTTSLLGFRLQREKLRQELKTEFMAEQAIVHLLQHATWKLRTFEVIRSHVGGFADDELRKLLVRAGAVRFYGPGEPPQELWGLRVRNIDRLGRVGPPVEP